LAQVVPSSSKKLRANLDAKGMLIQAARYVECIVDEFKRKKTANITCLAIELLLTIVMPFNDLVAA
jgi:hypothetical protein